MSVRLLSALSTVAVAAASLVPAQQALAQEAPTVLQRLEVEAESDDILVQDGYVPQSGQIGSKVDTPLVEVPQAVSTVTERQLDDQNPRSLNEALGYTASARVGAYGFDPRFDQFFVRGFPVTYNGIFRDGLRQYSSPTGLFRNEIYGLEGITVLKGPASALYGASTAGGLVNLMTKRPTRETFREVEGQIGLHDRYQGNFDFSGPVNEDETLFYRLTGVVRDSGTEIDGFPDDRVYIAPALTWEPDADTRFTVLGEYMDSKTGGTAAYFNDADGVTDIYHGVPQYNDFDQQQFRIGYEFEHRFNDVFTVRQNARYAEIDNTLEYTNVKGLPGSPDFDCASGGLTGGLLTDIDRCAGFNAENMDTFVIDNQVQADFDTGPLEHLALFGLDYGHVAFDQRQGYGEYPFPGSALPTYFTQAQQFSQIGVYAQDRIRYGKWALTVGGRYDWLTGETTTPDGAGGVTSFDQDDEQFSTRVGLSYVTDFGLVPYANYTTSFTPNVGTVVGGTPARPSVGEQKEIGLKYEVPGYNAVVTAALFDIEQKDGVVFDASSGINEQVHRDLRSRGFEIEGATSLDNGVNLIASYAYVDMEILRGAAGTVGNELSSTPRHTFSLWGDYTIRNGAAAGLGFGAGLRYVGESFGDDFNTRVNEDRVLFDAAVHYDFGARNPDLEGLELQINATNIFDTRKQTCSSGYCYRDEGTQVVGSLRYRF